MKYTSLLLGLFALLTVTVRADQDIAISELPATVTKALEARFPGQVPLSAEKETEAGALVYEVKVRHDGKAYEATVSPEGTIQRIHTIKKEDRIPVSELPALVVESLKRRFPDGVLLSAEKERSLIRSYFEVKVRSNGFVFDVDINTDGKITKVED